MNFAAAAASQTWDSPATLVPLIVSLVALGGAVFASVWAGRKTIKAENSRAKNAIEAEDRRHANSLEQANVAWMRGAKAKAYFGVIEALKRMTQATDVIAWYARSKSAPENPDGPLESVNPDGVGEMIDKWNAAQSDALHRIAEIRAVGDPEIADIARKVVRSSGRANDEIFDAISAHPQVKYDPEKAGRRSRSRMHKRTAEMIRRIRDDLGADQVVPGSSASSASQPNGT